MGLFDDTYPAIAERRGLIDGEKGTEIYDEIAPADDEIVIKKHVTARSSERSEISSCEDVESIPSSSPA